MISVERPKCNNNDKLDILRSCFATGRLKDIAHRRAEISKLYRRLREDGDSICSSIAYDGRCSATVAKEEFRLTMDGIYKFHKDLISPNRGRTSISIHQDESEKKGLGIVAIKPSFHSRLYSTLIPLVGAIAAGNCVFLELAEESTRVDALIADILESSSIVQVSEEKLDNHHLSQVDLFVNQLESRKPQWAPRLARLYQPRALAIVHQDSDLMEAARLITSSRIAPYNSSPYSPSLIHVHHTILSDFKTCISHFSENASPYIDKSARTIAGIKADILLKQAEAQRVVKVSDSSASGLSLVEVLPRLHKSSPILNSQIEGPYLVVLPFTDPVDFMLSLSQTDPLLAVYIFGGIETCKALAGEIPAAATYCNQIPPSILYGPASPATNIHHLHPRYTTDMFSSPSPIIVDPAPEIPTETAELSKESRRSSSSDEGIDITQQSRSNSRTREESIKLGKRSRHSSSSSDEGIDTIQQSRSNSRTREEGVKLGKRSRHSSRTREEIAEPAEKSFVQRISATMIIPAAVVLGLCMYRFSTRGSASSLVRDIRGFGG